MGLTPLGVRDGAHPTWGAGWGLTPLWGAGWGLTPLGMRDGGSPHFGCGMPMTVTSSTSASAPNTAFAAHRCTGANEHAHTPTRDTHPLTSKHPCTNQTRKRTRRTQHSTHTHTHDERRPQRHIWAAQANPDMHATRPRKHTNARTRTRTPTHPRRPRACLDVGGEDVEAAREDHVLLAVADVQEAVGVLNIESSATSGSTL
jgi:hypothetical protein